MSGCDQFAHLDPPYRRYAAVADRERIQWIQADRWMSAAEQAILSGKERLDLQSFGDDLILPLVSMMQSAGRRQAGTALQASR